LPNDPFAEAFKSWPQTEAWNKKALKTNGGDYSKIKYVVPNDGMIPPKILTNLKDLGIERIPYTPSDVRSNIRRLDGILLRSRQSS